MDMKQKSILILALAITLMPFLGFPSLWKNIFFVITSLSIAVLTYRDEIRDFFSMTPQDSYVESIGNTSLS